MFVDGIQVYLLDTYNKYTPINCNISVQIMGGGNFMRFGADDRTWTCTPKAPEPKSGVSANFTTSAYWLRYYTSNRDNIKLSEEYEGHVCCVNEEHYNAFQTVDFFTCKRKDKGQNCNSETDYRVGHIFAQEIEGWDRSGDAQNEQDVENIWADDIAERDGILALFVGNERCYELGQWCSESNDREAYYRIWNAE